MLPLSNVLDSYILAHDLGPASRAQLRWTLRRFNRWLGHVATTIDLADDVLNRWINAMQDEGLARVTVRGQRGNLLTLWRWAAEESMHDAWPRRVKRVKSPLPIPEAWSLIQIAALLAQADKLKGRFLRSRVLRSAYFRAFILTAWDSAMRLGDLMELRFADVGADGSIVIGQHKTGWPILARLRPETVAAIAAMSSPPREKIFGEGLSRGRVFKYMRQMVAAAGLTGGTKKIRKGSATAVEAIMPGAAQRHLGHRTPGLAARHYIDPRLLADTRPMPPRIA